MANYQNPNKNRIREIIVNKIREKNIKTILTLESPKFLFSKLLPDKKIFVFEKDADVLTEMEKNTPKNVKLFFGNIYRCDVLEKDFDAIYLDFCGTWETEREVLANMIDKIKEAKFFAITLSLRAHKNNKDLPIYLFSKGDYQFNLLRQLQEFIGTNWKIVYGETYHDTSTMLTLMLEKECKEVS